MRRLAFFLPFSLLLAGFSGAGPAHPSSQDEVVHPVPVQVPPAASSAPPSPLFLPAPSSGVSAFPAPTPSPAEPDLYAALQAPALMVDGHVLDRPALESAYGAVNFHTLWAQDGQSLSRAEAIRDVLARAGEHALNPAEYHVDAITHRLSERTGVTGGAPARADQIQLDLLLTDGLMRYASDVRMGRVNPRQVPGQRFIRPFILDPVGIILQAATAKNLDGFLAALPPQSPLYQGQVRLLSSLRQQPDWPVVSAGRKLQKGGVSTRVQELRARLAATGDLGDASAEGTSFDDPLVKAVTAWQARAGLKADGVVGARSLAELNVSRGARVEQVTANMERQRWLPDDLGVRHVRVNVPAYTLYAVTNGRDDLVMKTIVGRKERPTPLFADTIRFVEFNPTWSVPSTIAREDILPHLREDPGYALEHKNVHIYRNGVEVDPWSVDWHTANIRTYTLRAPPGPRNPLGTVKFLFPNAFDVYLHDTSEPNKFNDDERAFSSGCVRVSDPAGLANWLLADKPGWTDTKRQRILASGKQSRIDMETPVPVWLTYTTAWLDGEGHPAFRADLYGLDAALAKALKESEGKPRRLAVSMVRATVAQPAPTDPLIALPGTASVPQAAP